MKRILMTTLSIAIAAAACTSPNKSSSSVAQNEGTPERQNSGAPTEFDVSFAEEAANGGLMEVELGKIAESNASSSRVKKFGSMMIADHNKANVTLKKLASGKNIKLPDSVQGEPLKDIQTLRGKKGVEFDKAYMKMMVDDHKKDVAKFEDAAKSANDDDFKTFASNTLPVLKVHLDSAEAINKAVQGTTDPGAVTNGMQRQTNP